MHTLAVGCWLLAVAIKAASMGLIEKVLAKHGGNRKAAAAELGISERTLYRKIKQLTE